jgi:thioredoxin reductase
MMNATVTVIRPNTSGFQVGTSDGVLYKAHKVVLATGMQDIMPSTPGVAENWGKGIFWCPWCDGYEHRDQKFGIIGSYADVLSTVFEVATLETDIIAFVNGTQTPEIIARVSSNPPAGYNSWQEKLQKYNIAVENRTMESITRLQDGSQVTGEMSEIDLFRVTFTDGSTVERNAFIANFPSLQRSDLGTSMGIPVDAKDHVKTSGDMQSIVPGVYVVGDANADNSTNVPHAIWSGKRAAVAMHIALEEEHSDAMISTRDLRLREDEISDFMGRDLQDIYEHGR